MKTVAKAIILDGQSNVLLLVRSNTHPKFSGHFDFPGGEVEPGETPPEATAREILEELGLIVKAKDLQLVFEDRVSADLLHIVYQLHLDKQPSNIKLSWEHSGYQWIPLKEFVKSELPKNVDIYHLSLLKHLLKESPN